MCREAEADQSQNGLLLQRSLGFHTPPLSATDSAHFPPLPPQLSALAPPHCKCVYNFISVESEPKHQIAIRRSPQKYYKWPPKRHPSLPSAVSPKQRRAPAKWNWFPPRHIWAWAGWRWGRSWWASWSLSSTLRRRVVVGFRLINFAIDVHKFISFGHKLQECRVFNMPFSL